MLFTRIMQPWFRRMKLVNVKGMRKFLRRFMLVEFLIIRQRMIFGVSLITVTEEAAKRAMALDGADMGGFFLKVQHYNKTTPQVAKTPAFTPPVIQGYNWIYAGNLSWDITEDDLRNLFSDCSISSIRFGEDKETGAFKGYAHVDLSDESSLEKALKLDQELVCGRPVRITCAVALRKPQSQQSTTKSAVLNSKSIPQDVIHFSD